MMLLNEIFATLLSTLRDVAPIIFVIIFFQLVLFVDLLVTLKTS